MKAQLSLGTLLAGTALMLVAMPACAQTEAGAQANPSPDQSAAPVAATAERNAPQAADVASGNGAALTEIVVTGTQLRGLAPVGSSVISVGQQSIQNSGLATSADVIRSIPQVSGLGPGEATTGTNVNNATLNTSKAQGINLRGLGVQATLTLVDGRRQPAGGVGGQLFDPSVIPAIALSRVDVVADGASATYGSDAVAGVVNLILRKNFNGVEFNASHGFADDYHDNQIAAIIGHRWSSGSFMVAGEYYAHSRLREEDRRNLFTCNLVPYGGRNNCSTLSAPGNVTGAGGTLYGLPGGSGQGLTAADLSNIPNTKDVADGQDAIPYLQRKSVVANLTQKLTDKLTLTLEGYFSRRDFDYRAGGATMGSATPVPSSNPFFIPLVPGQTSQVVQYNMLNDLGTTVRGGYERTYQMAAGMDYDIDSNFRLSLSAAHSGNEADEGTTNAVNNTLLAAALADSDPTTAFNPYGSGGNNNPDTLNSFRAFNDRLAYFYSDLFDAKIDGSLAHLPGGDIKVAIGGEFHHDYFRGVAQGNDVSPTLSQITVGADSFRTRNVYSVFGEVNFPLFGPDNARPGLERLEIDVAGRYDHYSDVGRTTNPKIGVRYDPFDGLSIHASYGTSFRAPTLSDVNPGSTATAFEIPNFAGFGNVLEYVGGNGDLRPETATTYSLGAEFQPKSVRGLSLSVNYYHIRYNNVIDTPPLFSPVAFLDPSYAPFVTVNPTVDQVNAIFAPSYMPPQSLPASSITHILDARRHNLGGVHTDGLDFEAHYDFDTGIGTFSVGGNATYILHYKVAQVVGAPFTERVNQANFPLRFRGRANVGWHDDHLRFVNFFNFSNAYENLTGTIVPEQPVASYFTDDLTLAYNFGGSASAGGWAKGLELSVNARNLFDRKPPFAVIATTQVYDSTAASPVGRIVTLTLRKKF